MTWRALLDGDDARRARDAIDRIVGELARREIVEASLGNGWAGIALFHGYRVLAGDAAAEEPAIEAIQHALEGIERRPEPWLFSGYAGTAFALHHLAPAIGEADETLASLDALIAAWVDGDRWPYRWELMHGLVGLGVYALDRGDRALTARAMRHLESRAERDGDRVTWRAVDDRDVSTYHDLGVAHGVAGVVGFLAEVAALDPTALPLLTGAVAWLRVHERPDEHPRYRQALDRSFDDLRVDGWCYGDPATALVLAHAGLTLGDAPLVRAARALARAAARRTDAELSSLLLDAGLCHGTAGRAHVANRLGQALADDELLAAARMSYVATIDRCGSLGATEPGLRGGLAGIALALLAAITPIEPRWDRAFLLALPAR